VNIKRGISGPYASTIDVLHSVERSTIKTTYRLETGSKRLKVNMLVNWHEPGSETDGIPNLKLSIGTALKDAVPTYEIPFGCIERKKVHHHDVPTLRWTLLESAKKMGLFVTNDCKYGQQVADGVLRINLLRSSYAPDPNPELQEHLMGFTVEAVPRGVSRAELTAMGQACDVPVQALRAGVQEGVLGVETSAVRVSGEGVVLSGVRRGFDGEDAIVRLYNMTQKATKAQVEFAGKRVRGADVVDLLERKVKGGAVSVAGAKVGVQIPASGIVTLRVKM